MSRAKSLALAAAAEPAWRWESSRGVWSLPVVVRLGVVVRLEHEDGWSVVIADVDGDQVVRRRIALALGGFAEHKALGRLLWRRLQRVSIDAVGLIPW